MKLLNPHLDIHNAEGNFILVTMDHEFNENERMSVTLLVARQNATLVDVQRALLLSAKDRIQTMLNNLG